MRHILYGDYDPDTSVTEQIAAIVDEEGEYFGDFDTVGGDASEHFGTHCVEPESRTFEFSGFTILLEVMQEEIDLTQFDSCSGTSQADQISFDWSASFHSLITKNGKRYLKWEIN